jgi:transposase
LIQPGFYGHRIKRENFSTEVFHAITEESEAIQPSALFSRVQDRGPGLAEQVGVAGAAKQLGLHESQLYAWRKKARYEASRSETEKALAIENAKLKRQLAKKEEELAILKKAAAYFAKSLK